MFTRLAALFVALLFFTPPAQAEARFHAPSTPAEKALDAIFRRNIAERESLQRVLYQGVILNSRDRKNAALFSRPLRRAILAAERAEVKRQCGGKYRKGEICGLDFDVLFCGQDYPERFRYQTLFAGQDKVTLAWAWPSESSGGQLNVYRLEKTGRTWKLDGIKCAGFYGLNMEP